MPSEELRRATCPNCDATLNEPASFCPFCGGFIEELEEEQGVSLKSPLLSRRPRLVIVVGMWLLVLPAALVTISLLTRTWGEGYFASAGFVLVFLIYAAILYQVTKNYISRPQVPDDEGDDTEQVN